MARQNVYRASVGLRTVTRTSALSGNLADFVNQMRDGLTALLRDEMRKQLADVRAAWPQPPDRVETRQHHKTGTEYQWRHRRTGKSQAGFVLEYKIRGNNLVFVINNTAKKAGETYAWWIHTKDLDMDGRKGKVTRAWHHFRRRALRMVERAIIAKHNEKIPKEV